MFNWCCDDGWDSEVNIIELVFGFWVDWCVIDGWDVECSGRWARWGGVAPA